MKPMLISTKLPGVHNYSCSCGNELAESGKDFILLEVSGSLCKQCGGKVKAWEHVLKYLGHNPIAPLMSTVLDFAGFKGVSGSFHIKPFSVKSMDFNKVGVPEGALILDVNYTPVQSSGKYMVFPQEMHGNTPERKSTPYQINLYGCVTGLPEVKFREGVYGCDTSIVNATELVEVHYMVKFVEGSDYDLAVNYLNKATKAFHEGDIEQCILNSAIASEVSVSKACTHFWKHHFNSEKRRKLSKNETFMNKLQYHLKLASDKGELEILNGDIRTSLCNLANRRNEIMHLGHLPEGVDDEELNKLIAAAFFVEGYCKILIEKLDAL